MKKDKIDLLNNEFSIEDNCELNNASSKEGRSSSSLEEALKKLNSLNGLKDVKREIERIVKLIRYELMKLIH